MYRVVELRRNKAVKETAFINKEEAKRYGRSLKNARVYAHGQYAYRVHNHALTQVIGGSSAFDNTGVLAEGTEENSRKQSDWQASPNYTSVIDGAEVRHNDAVSAIEYILREGGTGRVLNSAGAAIMGVIRGIEYPVPCYTVSRWEKNKAGWVNPHYLEEGQPVNIERNYSATNATRGISYE